MVSEQIGPNQPHDNPVAEVKLQPHGDPAAEVKVRLLVIPIVDAVASGRVA